MNKITLISNDEEKEIVAQIEQTTENSFSVLLDNDNHSLYLNIDSKNSGYAKNLKTNEITPFYYLIKEGNIELWLKGNIYKYTELDTKKKAIQNINPHQKQDLSGVVRAPMPGTILKILTENGSEVKANVPLIVMESMKMELTIVAPMDGIITDISCTNGQMVEMNAVLIKLEQVDRNETTKGEDN